MQSFIHSNNVNTNVTSLHVAYGLTITRLSEWFLFNTCDIIAGLLYSARLLKQHSTCKHNVPLTHNIILIPNQPVFGASYAS